MKRFKKIYIEITNVCNLHCSFCHGTSRTPGFLSVEDFTAYALQLRPYSDYLYLHVMGEPLLHPQLEQILSIAGQLGYRIIITTNGTLLQSREGILHNASALDKINISLHSFEANANSGQPESYVAECISFAKRVNHCKINFRLWNLNGLDSKNECIMSLLHNAFPSDWISTRNGMKLEEGIYLQFAEKFDWPDFSAPDYGEHGFCFGLRDQLGILCDGTVVPCCLDSEGTIALGNLKDDNIDKILNGERAQSFYSSFSDRHRSEELCRHCGFSNRFSK